MTTFDSININNIINNNNNNINNKNKNRTTSLNYNIFKTIDNITNNENFELYSKAQLITTVYNLINQIKKQLHEIYELEEKLREDNNSNLYRHIDHCEARISCLNSENEQLKKDIKVFQESADSSQLCCICYSKPRNFINTSCGHLCVCETCSGRLNDKCPICRTSGNFIKTIVS